MKRITLHAPYLILIGDNEDPTYAKTGFGIVHWSRERVAGQLRFEGGSTDLGVPDMTVRQAVQAGVRTLVIGVAPIGGVVPESWCNVIVEAATAGLDVACGLHLKLEDFSEVRKAAEKSGARLINVRVPPARIPVGTGKKRCGKRMLTVGTDCAVGKKYSALALYEAMRRAAHKATFRATGQTGIMLSGSGIPIDAVVSDFVSGAAEILSPDNDDDHWDIIEGQGSLFHPGYASVSLGLLHGSQPDAVVVCHDATRNEIAGWPGYQIPSIADCIERNLMLGRLTNPNIRCIGVCINTSGIADRSRRSFLATIGKETGLPCIDPVIDGGGAIVDTVC